MRLLSDTQVSVGVAFAMKNEIRRNASHTSCCWAPHATAAVVVVMNSVIGGINRLIHELLGINRHIHVHTLMYMYVYALPKTGMDIIRVCA